MVKQCPTCVHHFSPRKEPMIITELPQYPWQRVEADLFHLMGAKYLPVVDYFSRYPEVQKLKSTTSEAVINKLKSTFAWLEIPETVISDNGPQFSPQLFEDFADAYSFDHVTNSPLFSQSNGLAVKTVKKLLTEGRCGCSCGYINVFLCLCIHSPKYS